MDHNEHNQIHLKAGHLLGASERLTSVMEALTERVSLVPGEILFAQGDPADALYTLETGEIEISVLSAEGRKLSLHIMHTGELLGEIALFDKGSRTATATATEGSTLLRIGRAALMRALEDDAKLAIDMIEVAGRRLRRVSNQLHDYVFLPMHTRLARKVLELSESPSGPLKQVAMSQGEIADFVGSSREAVSRTLSVWKRDGVVDIGRGTITIRQRSELKHIAAFDVV